MSDEKEDQEEKPFFVKDMVPQHRGTTRPFLRLQSCLPTSLLNKLAMLSVLILAPQKELVHVVFH